MPVRRHQGVGRTERSEARHRVFLHGLLTLGNAGLYGGYGARQTTGTVLSGKSIGSSFRHLLQENGCSIGVVVGVP